MYRWILLDNVSTDIYYRVYSMQEEAPPSFCMISFLIPSPEGFAAKFPPGGEALSSCPLFALEQPRGAHAAPDAHRDRAQGSVSPLHLVQQRGGELRTRAPQRVPQRDRAPVDVDLVRIQGELADHRKRLCGEGLVQLEEVDPRLLDPQLLQ